ncbi:hypothetical protein HKD37_10G029614 [Glycine soja]
MIKSVVGEFGRPTFYTSIKERGFLKKENKKAGEEKCFGIEVRDFGDGPSNSKTVSLQQVGNSEGSSKTVRYHDNDDNNFDEKEIKSNPDIVASKEHDVKNRGRQNGLNPMSRLARN